MVKIRGILNATKMILLAHEQGQSYIKSKLYFFLVRVCGAMKGFLSRNTSLRRHNKVFRDEKRVVVLHTLSKKKTLQF